MSSDSSSNNIYIALQSAFTLKQKNLPWLLLVLLMGTAVFFISQFATVFLVVLVLTIAGQSEDQIESAFSEASYWPKFVAFALIAAVMIWLAFWVSGLLLRMDERRKLKKTEKTHKKTKLAKKKQLDTDTVSRSLTLRADIRRRMDFLLIKRSMPTLRELFEILGTYGLYFFTTIVVSALLTAFGLVDPTQMQDIGIAQPDTRLNLLAIYLMLVILPPLAEEVLFRGFLYNALAKYAGVGISFVLTCVLFGFAHLELGNSSPNWNAAVDTMIFSGYLIYISQRHQSLYSSIILHGLKNGLAFIILFGASLS